MAFDANFFDHDYYPAKGIPFFGFLEGIFFPDWQPDKEPDDYPIHGPNVIRMVQALYENDPTAPGLLRDGADSIALAAPGRYRRSAREHYENFLPKIRECLGIGTSQEQEDEWEKTKHLLSTAALYHDIGKAIRRANHPQIGANLVRSFNREEQQKLVDGLKHEKDRAGAVSPYHRFSLILSIIQHHDKFGVLSTGEAALPIISDVLYFTSNELAIAGVKKNITSVMLVNLADIAAVCRADKQKKKEANRIACEIRKARLANADAAPLFTALTELITVSEHCLGLTTDKLRSVLNDWEAIISAVDHSSVRGNRVAMKLRLLDVERNPARAIERIRRLLWEACDTTKAQALALYMTPSAIESILVATLGAHQFQSFCEQFATIAKIDYALGFFKGILSSSVRSALKLPIINDKGFIDETLSSAEIERLGSMAPREQGDVAEKITILFVRVLESLVARYTGVLNYPPANPRRFGFQMKNLVDDPKVRSKITDLLCGQSQKEPIALTWIADEVTVWSMD